MLRGTVDGQHDPDSERAFARDLKDELDQLQHFVGESRELQDGRNDQEVLRALLDIGIAGLEFVLVAGQEVGLDGRLGTVQVAAEHSLYQEGVHHLDSLFLHSPSHLGHLHDYLTLLP